MSDTKLDRIEAKLDDTNDQIGEIKVILGAQHVSLQEHMRRTKLIEDELRPIKKHVNMVQGAAALIGLLATIAAIVELFVRR